MPGRLPGPRRLALAGMRAGIDVLDGAHLALLAGRGRLAEQAGRLKRSAGLPARDRAREAQVLARAQRLAHGLGLAPDTAQAAVALAVADALRRQGLPPDLDQGPPPLDHDIIAPIMQTATTPRSRAAPAQILLRMIPPPWRLAPLVRAVPARVRHRALAGAMARVLAAPLADGALAFMQGRRLGIEVTDLELRWVVALQDGALVVSDGTPDASVRGTATDLLLMACRLEDADTLFFQRRLELTGDTELGLTARNLLDRLPWASIPLGLRIGLNRCARLARAARAAHHARHATAAVAERTAPEAATPDAATR